MDVEPTQGTPPARQPAQPDAPTKSGPANTAPKKPLPANVTPGNLAPSRSTAEIARLDKVVTGDLVALKVARSEFLPMPQDYADSRRSQDYAGKALTKFLNAETTLARDLRLAVAARLPTAVDSHFEEKANEVASAMIAMRPDDDIFRHAVYSAVADLTQHLPVAVLAAVITERSLSDGNRHTLATEYQVNCAEHPTSIVFDTSPALKEAIRSNPGYQSIIDKNARACFDSNGKTPKDKDYVSHVLSNVRAVVESSHSARTDSDIVQDFLTSVVKYAKSQCVVLPDVEIQSLYSQVLGGPM
jgi:hypothetical protein